MPKGKEFSDEMKQLMFKVINFVDSEKNGPIIPLFNANHRLAAMLGVSERSICRLRSEITSLKEVETKIEEKKKDERQSRSRTASQTSVSTKRSHKKSNYSVITPTPISPKKKNHSGRKPIELTEFQQDIIRYCI